jgi:MbtH protein
MLDDTDTERKDDDTLVLVNDEQQYSLWQAGIDIPAGWTTVFGPSAKADCLAYVEREWTDMRPLSLRRQMEGHSS